MVRAFTAEGSIPETILAGGCTVCLSTRRLTFQFAFTHCTLLMIVTQSFLIINNLLQGLVWFLIPVSMIICCDIMSYMFGFFWGKTPLIKLSPKKTVEGFIGGGISTILFGLVVDISTYQSVYLSRPV